MDVVVQFLVRQDGDPDESRVARALRERFEKGSKIGRLEIAMVKESGGWRVVRAKAASASGGEPDPGIDWQSEARAALVAAGIAAAD